MCKTKIIIIEIVAMFFPIYDVRPQWNLRNTTKLKKKEKNTIYVCWPIFIVLACPDMRAKSVVVRNKIALTYINEIAHTLRGCITVCGVFALSVHLSGIAGGLVWRRSFLILIMSGLPMWISLMVIFAQARAHRSRAVKVMIIALRRTS